MWCEKEYIFIWVYTHFCILRYNINNCSAMLTTIDTQQQMFYLHFNVPYGCVIREIMSTIFIYVCSFGRFVKFTINSRHIYNQWYNYYQSPKALRKWLAYIRLQLQNNFANNQWNYYLIWLKWFRRQINFYCHLTS